MPASPRSAAASKRRRYPFVYGRRRWLAPRRIAFGLILLVVGWALSRLWSPNGTEDSPSWSNASHSRIRRDEALLPNADPLYRALAPLQPPTPPFPVLRQTRGLPPKCLEAWFIRGELDCSLKDIGAEDKLDVTWLWVNGSDTRWSDEMIYWRRRHDIYSPDFHFRELGELVYSMRSALSALMGQVGNFHLILYDYAFDTTRDQGLLPKSKDNLLESADIKSVEDLRIAQTPAWMNFSSLLFGHSGYPDLRYAVHSEVFRLPTVDRQGNTEDMGVHSARETAWRDKALPTYSSKSIESRLGWLPDLADAFVAMNDDFFLLRPHSISDFHSILYGSAIRFDSGFYQQVRPVLNWRTFNDAGETGGLYHANFWLSKRFPPRLRPYIAHGPKILSRSLHHEASLMFAEPLTNSSSRRFRELPDADGDIQIQWLLTALRVERWREALLWTYVVANIGAKEGFWGRYARNELGQVFDVAVGGPDSPVTVQRGQRYTLEQSRIDQTFRRLGWEPPKVAKYTFSSLDGHMPPIIHHDRDQTVNDYCTINMNDCFGSLWQEGTSFSSDEIFKRITFQQPACGDCLIMALVKASGPLGLSAFFPPPTQKYKNLRKGNPTHLVPHLPLTPTWEEANFSLPAVLAASAPPGKVNLRQYCMKLLSRYLYVSADVPAEFHMLKDIGQTKESLNIVDDAPLAAALGLNDNLNDDAVEGVKKILHDWFERKWPERAPWERE